MTSPAFRSPWDFPAQLDGWCDGRTDRDVIRPVGISTTSWVRLEVPAVLAREMASRWIGNVGFIEVSEYDAFMLLLNDVWKALNTDVARRMGLLAPDLLPPPEADPSTETMGQERLREARELRQRIADCLRSDPSQNNRMIARLIAPLNKKLVIRVRRQLEAAGEIAVVPPAQRKMRRAGRPRTTRQKQ